MIILHSFTKQASREIIFELKPLGRSLYFIIRFIIISPLTRKKKLFSCEILLNIILKTAVIRPIILKKFHH